MSDTEAAAKLSEMALQDDEMLNSHFDGLKKKKKPKKKVDFDETIEDENGEVAPLAPEEDILVDAAFSEKKKKKKAKPAKSAQEFGDLDDGELGAEGFDLTSLKKKKKSKKNMAAFEAELGDDLGGGATGAAGSNSQSWLGSDRDYSYDELLGRFYQILQENNPDLVGEKKRYTIAPPQIVRDGNKKSVFSNLPDICRRMHRPPEHLIQFLFAELGTSGSIDGSARLVIKGRFQQKQIENVLRRYIMEYVTCKTCKSGDTILTKENRLYFVQCESCGSTRSVAPIKTGFQANTSKRSVLRRAAV